MRYLEIVCQLTFSIFELLVHSEETQDMYGWTKFAMIQLFAIIFENEYIIKFVFKYF